MNSLDAASVELEKAFKQVRSSTRRTKTGKVVPVRSYFVELSNPTHKAFTGKQRADHKTTTIQAESSDEIPHIAELVEPGWTVVSAEPIEVRAARLAAGKPAPADPLDDPSLAKITQEALRRCGSCGRRIDHVKKRGHKDNCRYLSWNKRSR